MTAINSRVRTYPDVKQVNDERWVPPLPDDQKPADPNTPRCSGCGGYHGGVNAKILCLEGALAVDRAALAAEMDRTRAEMDRTRAEIERAAEIGYTACAVETFGVEPGPLPDRGAASGRHYQRRPVDWAKLPSELKDRWRRVAAAILRGWR